MLIGDRFGLTAKHCLFHTDERGSITEEANGGEFHLGASSRSVLKRTVLKSWKSHDSLDVAVFEIDRAAGSELGWASLRAIDSSKLLGASFSVTGYPAH